MNRKNAIGLLASSTTLGASPLLASCTKVATSGGNASGRHSWTIPHVLRYADAEDPVGLNPVVATHASTSWLAQLWAAWLFRYDENYDPVPELCTTVPTLQNGLISPDGKRIVFKLREAVWSDGVAFTSKDIAFSVATILAPNTNVTSRDGWDKIERVETPDPRTAIFHMKELYSAFIPTFFTTGGANPCILPEHIAKGQDPNHGPYNQKPIGIGPFVLDEWLRDQQVTLSANPRYFRGRPKLDKVIYKIIPNADTLITQLRTHEVDLWIQMNPNYYGQVAGINGIDIARRVSAYWRHFDCNCDHPGTSEIPVRQALNYAIDRKTIIDKALHGIGQINWSVVSPNSFAYNPNVKQYPFDLAKASALLDGAGWKLGADGVRAKNGARLHLNFGMPSGDPAWSEIVELVRSTWKPIGITFDSKSYPTNLYFAQFQQGGIVYAGKFDVCAFSWGNTPAPTDMVNLYAADQIPPRGQNDLRYRNAEATRAMHDATKTLDHKVQAKLLGRAQAIIADECPTFPIAQNVDLHPKNVDLKNFRPIPASGPFEFMMDVDI
ncbi:MAG: peptide ABC transporter substrate-binding protein [Candidatus Baltobacteraceae bacterium]